MGSRRPNGERWPQRARYNERTVAAYPRELEREVVLRDGARLRLRPIRPEDQDRLITFYDRLSRHTAYQRFFTVMKRLPPNWAHLLANVDYERRLALLAEHGLPEDPELVGVARYEPTGQADMAEIAFVIQDGWQNRGLGTLMLDALLAAAEARGIRRFRAYVLASNARMIDLLVRFTDVQERRMESGVTELLLARRPAVTGTGR
jgi:RimJ/RimL family protein N-acetyltransferase